MCQKDCPIYDLHINRIVLFVLCVNRIV
jgi:hypothetical protein